MPAFAYSKPKRKKRVTDARRGQPENLSKAEEGEPGEINGKRAGSRLEWNVARALWKLGWDFDFQFPVMGGRERRGGFMLDFLVHTIPCWTPMPVNGRHWHKDVIADQFENAQVEAALRRYGYMIQETVVVWEENCLTMDDAYQFLYSKIGKG